MPDWLTVVNDEIVIRFTPDVLTQIEQEFSYPEPTIHKLNSQDLLEVLASSLGFGKTRKGAIVIETYYTDLETDSTNVVDNSVEPAPVLCTVMNVSGDINQKIDYKIFEHPDVKRILWAHSQIVEQVTQQFVLAVENYLEAKLRPLLIASISTITVLAWREPIETHTRSFLFVAITVVAIAITTEFLKNKITEEFKPIARLFTKTGRNLLHWLESPAMQCIAGLVIVFLFVDWLMLKLGLIYPNRSKLLLNTIQDGLQLYLPLTIVSLRKSIFRLLSKILRRFPFIMKFFFGRFIQ